MKNEKKLVRPKAGRVFFGVAQGLGEYFDIDPVIFRILFIILTIWGGIGVILYILGIFLMPDEKADDLKTEAEKIKNSKEEIKQKTKARVQSVAEEVRMSTKDGEFHSGGMVFGLVIIVLGLMFLFGNIFTWFSWSRFWPLILIVIGLLIIAGGRKGKI